MKERDEVIKEVADKQIQVKYLDAEIEAKQK